jgi:AAA15 family ATPase/GTPase
MHPGYILELINFIVDTSQRFNVQFFITTHCSDVLEIFLSDDLEENKRAFLNKELRILKMGKIKDSRTLAECLDYTQAREAKNDLLLDLRGI